jgi:hypothetical protein
MKYKETKAEIEEILKQINHIVGFTPFGCSAMLTDLFAFQTYNSNSMNNEFSEFYGVKLEIL